MQQQIWIVTGHSESGDDYGPIPFNSKPSDEVLKELAHSWDGDVSEEGPGDYGSFVYLEINQATIR